MLCFQMFVITVRVLQVMMQLHIENAIFLVSASIIAYLFYNISALTTLIIVNEVFQGEGNMFRCLMSTYQILQNPK